jgi:hypothetical protein
MRFSLQCVDFYRMFALCFKLFGESKLGNAQTDLCAHYRTDKDETSSYAVHWFCLMIVLFSWKYATRIRGDDLTFLLQYAPFPASLLANIGKTPLPATHREVGSQHGCVSLRLNTAIQKTTNSLHDLYFRLPYADYSMTP